MRLSSPVNQLVSLHSDPSNVGPVKDTKIAGFTQGVHLYSMASPLDRGHRDPRSSYSTAFYPDPKLLAYSSPKTNATAKVSSTPHSGEDEAASDGEANENASLNRKRKLSWPPSDVARTDLGAYKATSLSPSQRRISDESGETDFKDLRMNPPGRGASSSGLVANERLPGISHFDEQMNSPWSIEAARRSVSLRSSIGEESLRRLSSQTFASPAENRSWRFSLQDSHNHLPNRGGGEYNHTSLSHSPSQQGGDIFRRPSSPSSINRQYQRGGGNSIDRMMIYRGVSPSMEGGSAAYASRQRQQQQQQERDVSPSHRGSDRDWNGGPPSMHQSKSQMEDRRRHSSMLTGYGSREHLTSVERARLDRRGMDIGSGNSTPTYGSLPMHHRQSESTLPIMQSSFSYDSMSGPGGLERNSFDSRSYERGDSPLHYAEDGRIDESSPRHHPYSMGAPGTSSNAPRRRGKLPKAVTDLLKSWLLEHSSHPYPTEDEKRRLCSVTGLSISQVSNWFINARRRILVPQGSGSFAIGPPQPDLSVHDGPRHSGPPLHHQHGLPPPPPHHMASSYSPPLSSGHRPPHYSMQYHPRGPPTHLPPLHQYHSRSSDSPHDQHRPFDTRPASHQSAEVYTKEETSHSPRNTSRHSIVESQGQ